MFHTSENLQNKMHYAVILPIVLYVCETWSHPNGRTRMRVTVKEVRSRIFEEREGQREMRSS